MALLDAVVVLVILLGCSTLGLRARPLLSEHHRNREVIEFVQLVVAMLVTFAALVLGLLTSSVKSSYDNVGELGIRELAPHNPMQRRLETTCIAQYERLAQTRWRLIEESVSSISTPFLIVLVFW